MPVREKGKETGKRPCKKKAFGENIIGVESEGNTDTV